MQLLDLPLAIGFGVPADADIEGARRVLQQLLLPGIDLVRMDLVALGKVGHRRLFPNRFQRDLCLQGAVNLASRLRHGLLRLPNGAADFQLSPWSPKRGPFQAPAPKKLDWDATVDSLWQQGGRAEARCPLWLGGVVCTA